MPEIELRAFGSLLSYFHSRNWPMPLTVSIGGGETPENLLVRLGIPSGRVEVVFVNGKVVPFNHPLCGGDRVAFVPPGIPSIHRVMLGFYGAGQK